MRILVACEFSGIVRDAFLSRGHDAWSCDLSPTESPGPHIQNDVLNHLNDSWDLMIAHPPCTYLCSAGYHRRLKDPTRIAKTRDAIQFFLALWNAPIQRICIENPPGVIRRFTNIPHHQTIHPWQFGEPYAKTFTLRLKNLNPLRHTRYIPPPYVNRDELGRDPTPESIDRWKIRSRFFPGIAEAMADRWGS
jgi:hypothetical protein